MKNEKQTKFSSYRSFIALCVALCSVSLIFSACEQTTNNPTDIQIDDTTDIPTCFVDRFQAYSYTGNDKIKYSYTYNNLDFYYIYLGELKNIPLFFDDVHRHGNIASEYTFSTTNITQTMVSQTIAISSAEAMSIIKENTKSKTTGNTAGGEIGAKLTIKGVFDLGGKGYYERNWGDTTSESTSIGSQITTSLTDTIEHGTSNTLETMKSRTFHLTKEDKTGYYRYTYFSVSDVYWYVIKDSNTGDFYYEFREHIKPGVYFWDLDYSETASFRKSDTTGFELDVSILDNLPKPTLVFPDDDSPDSPDVQELPPPGPVSVQEMLLNKAETHQESASSAEFISAAYDPDLKYVVLTYKVGTIKDMFLQYLSTVVVAGHGRELTYSEIVGNSLTEQVENIQATAMNFNGTVWYAGAGAFAGAKASASLGSLTGIEPEAKANAYAAAGAAAGKLSFDLESVTTTRYTQTYHQFLVVQNTVKQDLSIYPAGKKYAVAAFADVGIYQILKYDPQTKTATAIPGKSLWFNVESRPYWDMYEYSREEELSIPQQLKPFEKVNVEVSEDDLYAGLEKSQTITFYVGNPRVGGGGTVVEGSNSNGWYRTGWKPITLVFPVLRDFGYKTVSFEWKTYWAENASNLDCTAHVVLDCADRNLSRGNDWYYYDQIVNPGAGWKWATWNFNSPIGTVADRPNIRCAYGYDRQDKSYFLGIETGSSYYDLSGTVSVTVTAQK